MISVYRPSEWNERGEITLEAAAKIVGVIPMTALGMIKGGDLPGRQPCRGAPWVIDAADGEVFAAAKSSGRSLSSKFRTAIL